MSELLVDTLLELEAGLKADEEWATRAREEWNRAVAALAARNAAIDALRQLIATQNSKSGTGPTAREPIRRSRRDDVVEIMRDSPHETWSLAELVQAFDVRRLSLAMSDPQGTIKNLANRLVEEGVLTRVRPGVYRLAKTETIDLTQSKEHPRAQDQHERE